ncbi:MAG: FG-GAP-like repeat-containing protein [Limisphaerales bacterium]
MMRVLLLCALMAGSGTALPAPVQHFTAVILPPPPILPNFVPVLADWTFDEGTPGRPLAGITDQSGNQHDSVQLFGAPSFGTNACGGGSSLVLPEGAPFGFGSGFLVADAPDFDLTNAFTLEAVFEAGRDGFGFWRQVVGRDGGVGRPGLIPWNLAFHEGTREVAFSVVGADLSSAAAIAPFPDDGARHHVAGVYSNLFLRLYVDGVLVATNQAPAPPATGPMAGVSIGANSIGGFWLEGVLDRVRIASAALGPGEFLEACERFPDFRLESRTSFGLGIQNHGGAWGDYDGDGDPDLFVANQSDGGKLYRNDGGGILRLATNNLGGLPFTASVQGGAWADWDGDDDLDLAFADAAGPNVLLRNVAGNLTPLPGAFGDENRQSVSVNWLDANRDGRPDALFSNLAAPGNDLWLSRGDGSFERSIAPPFAAGQPAAHAAATTDLNLDGFPDLVVARRGAANGVWFNYGGTNFVAAPTNAPITEYMPPGATGVAVDYSFGNARPNVFLANERATNQLWFQNADGDFHRGGAGEETGDARSAVWADLDNDGRLDLITLGRDNRLEFFAGGDALELTRLGITVPLPGFANDLRSCAVADADGDGFLDVASFSSGIAASQLLLNTGNSNAWLRVSPRGPSAPDGRGVKVAVFPYGGGVPFGGQYREIHSGDNRASLELVAHFGLGGVTSLNRVEITWPSGARLVLRDVAARQTLTVTEPDFGTPQPIQLDRQTGLLRQQVTFWQLRADATQAVRLRLRGVPDDVQVVGGERTGPGEWSFLFRGPMPRLANTEMTFEFYRASRAWFDGVTYSVAEVVPRPPDDVPAGAVGVTVDRVELLHDGRPLVEFAATPGTRYLVQYADAVGEWRSASGRVTAGASRAQWVDTGAPKTAPRDAAGPARFYRVFRLDAAAP